MIKEGNNGEIPLSADHLDQKALVHLFTEVKN